MRFPKTGIVCGLILLVLRLAPAQTRVDLRMQSKNVDFSGASSTKPSKTGTALPGACSLGETFLKTNAPAGQNFYACTAANVWTPQGGGVANYATTFTSATTVSVPGTTHKLGTANLLVEIYDNATPAWWVEPDAILINPSTYDVTVTFARPQSGVLILNAAGGGAGSGAPTATATLDFPVIGSAACAQLTFALTGAATGDAVAPGWPATLPAGLIGSMQVSAADTIAVRLCNFSGASSDPASAVFRATILR